MVDEAHLLAIVTNIFSVVWLNDEGLFSKFSQTQTDEIQ